MHCSYDKQGDPYVAAIVIFSDYINTYTFKHSCNKGFEYLQLARQ